jgi:hypothetical protein
MLGLRPAKGLRALAGVLVRLPQRRPEPEFDPLRLVTESPDSTNGLRASVETPHDPLRPVTVSVRVSALKAKLTAKQRDDLPPAADVVWPEWH